MTTRDHACQARQAFSAAGLSGRGSASGQTPGVTGPVRVPEMVRRKALAVGPAGERWLDDLPALIADLSAEWRLDVGEAISGGSGAFVANAVMADGLEAVLKVAIPDGLVGHNPFDQELEMLVLGEGRGYVRVLRADEPRRVMLQERLGRPLSALGWPVETQIDAIAATLIQAWRPPPDHVHLQTGAEKAVWLCDFIRTRWEELDGPCPEATIEQAEGYTRSRQEAFDLSTALLIHGDAHPFNILEARRATESSSGFKLIDPEGMISEPAHDLAIPLRDWTNELLAADPVDLGLAWCSQLGQRTNVDPGPIWEWAFIERVSTGLFMLQLGDPYGKRLLTVAAAWTGAHPDHR